MNGHERGCGSGGGLDSALLCACVAQHVDVAADAVGLRPIPTGLFNTSFFVGAAEGEYVLRVAPPRDSVFLFYERDMMRQEPGIHRLLLEKTQAPVAPIVAYDDSHALLPRDYLLMERLPGEPLSEVAAGNTDAVMAQVGECLAATHALHAEAYGYIGEHRPMPPQRSWQEAFALMWRMLLDDIVASGHYSAEERGGLLRLLDAHAAIFDRPAAASLLHMDVWAQNILVDGTGELTGLIDWDRALWGDPEIEFAVLDYCGISTPAFWEGYGAPRDLSPEARLRTVFYLLYELQKYIAIREGRNRDSAGARAYKTQAFHLLQQTFG